jgi:phenylpropionate dioxygenase-like ring-hydroxylating dioxygenase large terminal subunit
MNDWHPVTRAGDVAESGVLGVRLLGEEMVVWRYRGQVLVWQDLCLHRGTRLSLGKVADGW